MLSESNKNFISREMSIELSSIEERVQGIENVSDKAEVESAISGFIAAVRALSDEDREANLYSGNPNKAEEYIEIRSNKFLENSERGGYAWRTLDSLSRAFKHFAYNGLHQLYTRQENEVWYPKVILTKELRPNNIEDLPEIVELYRGCDLKEYKENSYGQAWSTKEEVAKEFAFDHYHGQPWFNMKNRCVVKTKINKKFIFYYNSDCEFEAAINTNEIGRVTVET